MQSPLLRCRFCYQQMSLILCTRVHLIPCLLNTEWFFPRWNSSLASYILLLEKSNWSPRVRHLWISFQSSASRPSPTPFTLWKKIFEKPWEKAVYLLSAASKAGGAWESHVSDQHNELQTTKIREKFIGIVWNSQELQNRHRFSMFDKFKHPSSKGNQRLTNSNIIFG